MKKRNLLILIFVLSVLTLIAVVGLSFSHPEKEGESISQVASETEDGVGAEDDANVSDITKGAGAGAIASEAIKGAEAVSEDPAGNGAENIAEPSSEQNSEAAEGEPEPTPEELAVANGLAKVEPSEDRTEYRTGFFYQSLTDDVKERINGKSYPEGCTVSYDELRYLSVLYYDFNGTVQSGEIICNKAIAKDLIEIFAELYEAEYQIDKIRLIDEYDADDDRSCADNNTSSFCYRMMTGSTKKLSKHALGMAIDINPFQNPYVTFPNGSPTTLLEETRVYIDRSAGLPHMITEDDLCYRLFKEHGFTWGGAWNSVKDYQHFEK